MEPSAPSEPRSPGIVHRLGFGVTPDAQIRTVKAGVATDAFVALAAAIAVSEAALTSVVGLSGSTLARRKRSGVLLPAESEHLLRIANLFDRAMDVFGDDGDAADWLKAPNISLGGQVPLRVADTEIGAREVENLLGRIDYGVYS